jgi:hypothetical protein
LKRVHAEDEHVFAVFEPTFTAVQNAPDPRQPAGQVLLKRGALQLPGCPLDVTGPTSIPLGSPHSGKGGQAPGVERVQGTRSLQRSRCVLQQRAELGWSTAKHGLRHVTARQRPLHARGHEAPR